MSGHLRGTARHLELAGWLVGAIASAALIWASLAHRVEMDVIEVLGFITGAASVWLTVKQNIWNWPVGIANSAFYVIVFLHARLFAGSGLNVLYVVLGFLGWYWWLRGGAQRSALRIRQISPVTMIILTVTGLATLWGMTLYLASIKDSAPFLDALTTVLSLIAEYMLARKLMENWWVWITADVIYIGLYAYRSLYLTTILYGIYLSMCVVGFVGWRHTWQADRLALTAATLKADPAQA